MLLLIRFPNKNQQILSFLWVIFIPYSVINWFIDFYSMSTHLGLLHAKRLQYYVHYVFILLFHVLLFLKSFQHTIHVHFLFSIHNIIHLLKKENEDLYPCFEAIVIRRMHISNPLLMILNIFLLNRLRKKGAANIIFSNFLTEHDLSANTDTTGRVSQTGYYDL